MNKSEDKTVSGQSFDYQLDIRALFLSLWNGKYWIIGFVLLFAVVALTYSYLVKEEWSATAITDKPTVTALGEYHSQQQFLRSLNSKGSNTPVAVLPLSIAEEAYKEFTMQLASYDTRRDFWLDSPYYKQRMEGNARADAVLLDEFINNIVFTPLDEKKNVNDSIKLKAESAKDANLLLREYVAFANKRAQNLLNEDLKGNWLSNESTLQRLVNRQEAVARAIYQRKLTRIEQNLKIAQQHKIDSAPTSSAVPPSSDAELFLLGKNMLQAQLEALQASGPEYEVDYEQNKALLAMLAHDVKLNDKFQTYRYLRTPEEPVKRDSPRRVFLLILWGGVGALIGAGVALIRGMSRPKTVK